MSFFLRSIFLVSLLITVNFTFSWASYIDTVDISEFPKIQVQIKAYQKLDSTDIKILEDSESLGFKIIDTEIDELKTGIVIVFQPSLIVEPLVIEQIKKDVNFFFLENSSNLDIKLLTFQKKYSNSLQHLLQDEIPSEIIDFRELTENEPYMGGLFYGSDNYLLLHESIEWVKNNMQNSYDSLHIVMLYPKIGMFSNKTKKNEIIKLAKKEKLPIYGLEVTNEHYQNNKEGSAFFRGIFKETGGGLKIGNSMRELFNDFLHKNDMPNRRYTYSLSYESSLEPDGKEYNMEIIYGKKGEYVSKYTYRVPVKKYMNGSFLWLIPVFLLFLFIFYRFFKSKNQRRQVGKSELYEESEKVSSLLVNSNNYSKGEFVFGNATHVGLVRKVNEDYFGSFDTPNGFVFLVCDGMGGHVGGAQASRLAVNTIKEFLNVHKLENPIDALREAIFSANKSIVKFSNENPELKGMGSTCVVILIRANKVYYAHVGDSRIYLHRDQKLIRLTKDDSLVQVLIDNGEITEKQAETHPRRSQITNALGLEKMRKPHIAQKPIEACIGDHFLLCSDGLTSMVKDSKIQTVLNSSLKLQDKAEKLIEKANKVGGTDNITVQLVQFS